MYNIKKNNNENYLNPFDKLSRKPTHHKNSGKQSDPGHFLKSRLTPLASTGSEVYPNTWLFFVFE